MSLRLKWGNRSLAIGLLLLLGARSWAQLSPGELATPHQSLEGVANCTKCHEIGGKQPSGAHCLACHTALKARIDNGQGFHSSDSVKARGCVGCHSEHNGRSFELLHWVGGQSGFNHNLTGYVLEGKHRQSDCRNCHRSAFISSEAVKQNSGGVNLERTFLGLSTGCLNCHEDEHRGQMQAGFAAGLADPDHQCLACHTYDGWTPAPGFSHSRTAYPLNGKHLDVGCVKCHPAEVAAAPSGEDRIRKREGGGKYLQYSGLSYANCTPCHQDPHKGKMGGDCKSCHNASGFKGAGGTGFDHSRTGYPLEGQHTRVVCAKCHVSGNLTSALKHERCRDCHKDEHEGQFSARPDGGACEACHSLAGFVPADYGWEQHQQTRFPLAGSHLAVPCNQCHKQVKGADSLTYTQFRFTDLTCQGCHRDYHRGQVNDWIKRGGCEFCHITDDWRRVNFNHNQARFRLLGKHGGVACRACHVPVGVGTSEETLAMKPVSEAGLAPYNMENACFKCHKDIHNGQFREPDSLAGQVNCARCHSPEGWTALLFKHDRDAKFRLEGAHEKVTCTECHKTTKGDRGEDYVVYRPLSTACESCHGGTAPARDQRKRQP